MNDELPLDLCYVISSLVKKHCSFNFCLNDLADEQVLDLRFFILDKGNRRESLSQLCRQASRCDNRQNSALRLRIGVRTIPRIAKLIERYLVEWTHPLFTDEYRVHVIISGTTHVGFSPTAEVVQRLHMWGFSPTAEVVRESALHMWFATTSEVDRWGKLVLASRIGTFQKLPEKQGLCELHLYLVVYMMMALVVIMIGWIFWWPRIMPSRRENPELARLVSEQVLASLPNIVSQVVAGLNANQGLDSIRNRECTYKSFRRSGWTINLDRRHGVCTPHQQVYGELAKVSKVVKKCTLNLVGKEFSIDLIPIKIGSFDIIVGMDWMSSHRATICCAEKIVLIPLPDGSVPNLESERKELIDQHCSTDSPTSPRSRTYHSHSSYYRPYRK
ncbi:hypothetical protein OSB04_012334 [Centaurea solstitialis]|uniref:Reverse transcriptase domain-containing protein n=1 Tax=Centaurea solstitialis TaxID=347529 RepID=A0AA38WMC3_9ASTR|nr:hypothetical protein OSB04_012334 [Centaurea solstitialis]